MESKIIKRTTAMTVFVAVTIPFMTAQGQEPQHKKGHHRYKLVDIGTFGGPASFVNPSVNGGPTISARGSVVGSSATSVPTTPHSHPFVCFGLDGTVPFVFHAFESHDAAMTGIGALPPAVDNCSNAQGVNTKGEIIGLSEHGKVDPLTGINEARAVIWKDGKIEELGTFGKEHHRYKLIDVGTLGGPQSARYFGDAQSLNNRGTVVGQADTANPDPKYPNFNPYIDFGAPDPFVLHAFQWHKGKLTDLGALPGANSTSVGWINQKGDAAGASQDGTLDPLTGWPRAVAVLWKDGVITNLGTLGGFESFSHRYQRPWRDCRSCCKYDTRLISVSDWRTLSSAPGYGTQQRAFLWDDGEMHDIGTLGGPDAAALLMNERGQIAGVSYTSSTPNPSGVPTVAPFLWEKGRMINLGSFGGTAGGPNWLNKRGQVVGLSNLSGDTTAHPFLWSEAEGMKDLGTLGGTFGSANWVNDTGEVVGAANTQGDDAQFAFLWKDGVMTNLGTVDGYACSIAFNINSHGQIVGSLISAHNCFNSDSGHAFLWEKGGPMVDLNIFVPRGSGLTLTQEAYINDRGEILATGVLTNGDLRTILLIPCGREDDDEQDCEDGREATPVAPGEITRGSKTALPVDGNAFLQQRLRFRRFGVSLPSHP